MSIARSLRGVVQRRNEIATTQVGAGLGGRMRSWRSLAVGQGSRCDGRMVNQILGFTKPNQFAADGARAVAYCNGAVDELTGEAE